MMQAGTWPETLLLPDERTHVLVAWELGWSAHQHVGVDTAHAKRGCPCTHKHIGIILITLFTSRGGK